MQYRVEQEESVSFHRFLHKAESSEKEHGMAASSQTVPLLAEINLGGPGKRAMANGGFVPRVMFNWLAGCGDRLPGSGPQP